MVSLDDLRADLDVDATENQGEVIQAARESCREHLRAGRDFAFNAHEHGAADAQAMD